MPRGKTSKTFRKEREKRNEERQRERETEMAFKNNRVKIGKKRLNEKAEVPLLTSLDSLDVLYNIDLTLV